MTTNKPFNFFSFKHIDKLYTDAIVNKANIKNSLAKNLTLINHNLKVFQSNLNNVTDIVHGDGLNSLIAQSVDLDFNNGDISEQEYTTFINTGVLPYSIEQSLNDIKDGLKDRITFYTEQIKTLSDNQFLENKRIVEELQTNKTLLENQELINKYYRDKNKVLAREYDLSINFRAQVKSITDIKRNKIYFKYSRIQNIKTCYVDNRQNFNKTNIPHIIYKMYIANKITKNEYRRFERYGKISENIASRITSYLIHNLNKVGHKKHYNTLTEHKAFNTNVMLNDLFNDDVVKPFYVNNSIKIKKNISDVDALLFTIERLKTELQFKALNDGVVFAYSKL